MRPLSWLLLSRGLFFVSLTLALSGCGISAAPESAPLARSQALPVRNPARTPTPELAEQAAFARPSVRRGEPLYRPRRRRSRPVAAETPKEAAMAVPELTAPPSPSTKPPLSPSKADHFTPSSYPTAEPGIGRSAGSKSARPKEAPSGEGEQEQGVFFEFSEETRAKAVYAPVIAFDNLEPVRAMYANKELTVRFDVSPNGRFNVRLVEGTGDPELDRLALETLRQWRWRPKTVRRRPVGSIEILTLHARVQ